MNADLTRLALNPKDWRNNDAIAEALIRATLAGEPLRTFTSSELATAILGHEIVKTADEYLDEYERCAKRAFYAAMRSQRLPSHSMADCARRDTSSKLVMGKLVHGWLWQHPSSADEWSAI